MMFSKKSQVFFYRFDTKTMFFRVKLYIFRIGDIV